MKKSILITLMAMIAFAFICRGTIGDTFQAIMADTSGNIRTTPLTFSNQVNMTVSATNAGNLVRYGDYTNSSISIITSGKLPIANGGTATNTTLLTGSWTNSVNFRVNGTNSAIAYSAGGIVGFSGSITNSIGTVTNVMTFGGGILTNLFRP